MDEAKRAGRIVGALILVQVVGSPLVNFVLEGPLFGTPGYLAAAAGHPWQIAAGALLGLGLEALWLGMAIAALGVLLPRSRALAVWLVALATVTLGVAVAEAAGVMSMISVSSEYAKATAGGREHLEAVRVIVAAARNWAHYLGRIADAAVTFLLYAALFRFRLVPRLLAGCGLAAAVLMLVAIARPFFGLPVLFPLLAPLGLCHLAMAIWLLAKGFGEGLRSEVVPAAG